MTKKSPSILLAGIAALALLGCSKQPVPPPAPAPAPANVAGDEEMMDDAVAQHPQAPKETTAQQAAKLVPYIQDKPECQSFRSALEQAQAPGATANLEQVMADAYKAGCSK